MNRSSFRDLATRRVWLLAAVAVCAFSPAVARAAETGSEQAHLSPRLEELARPAVRRAPAAVQAARVGLPSRGPGSLLRDDGAVLVSVRFDRGAVARVGDLEDAGGEIVDISRRYQTVTVAAQPADLAALGEVAGVGGVTEILSPIVRAPDCGGAVRSEGDLQLRAAAARAKWDVDGSGVTVGILSDSFDRAAGTATHAAGDVASGDLPGPGSPCGSRQPVGVFDDRESKGHDEGRAMAQVVHDLAPGAAIDFATAFTGEQGFADNIRGLAAAGARVIVDDVGYFEEPFFQDGPVAQAVNEVTGAGVSYFSAAGNDNLIDGEGHSIASWEAPSYRDSGSCPAAIVSLSEELEEAEAEEELTPKGLHPEHCMDFDPGAGADQRFGVTVESLQTLKVDLQWAEPWFGVGTDLDVFLLDEEGKLLEFEHQDNVGESQRPFEFLAWKNPGPEQEVTLVVNRFSGDEPRLKLAILENGSGVSGIEYPVPAGEDVVGPTIFGHSGAERAISVGAVPFDESAKPEEYSSHGPVTHYFGPVSGAAPAAPLPSPQTIPKPDLVATDGGANTFFGQLKAGVWRFFGTSAAAPHAAAVAALVHQGNPGASAAEVRADLASTARPVGAFGPEAVGAGLIDADAAVNLLALPPRIAIAAPPAPLSRERRPTIAFLANRPAVFGCSVDGGAPSPCASPFTVPFDLADGEHSIEVTGTDLAGRTGSSGRVLFRIDTRAPETSIATHPRKLIRTRHRRVKAVFSFRADESDVSFLCQIDKGAPQPCGARLARRYTLGRHILRVAAQDRLGNADPSAAVFRFRVKRIG
jgi:hypothetical protein